MIRKRYELLAPLLDERRLRLYVAAEALTLGYGGTTLVSQVFDVNYFVRSASIILAG